MAEPLLRLEGVSAGYGATHVLEGLDLVLAEGESVSLIGRNGVGKSTLLTTIMGHTVQHGGRLYFDGAEISRLRPYRRVRAGLAWVPQEREIFASLTVRENLEVAARPGEWTIERVFAHWPQLAERAGNRGNQLSGGEQQMLAIGRALMGNPRLLLLDEPSEGLAPVIVEALHDSLVGLRDREGLTILLVEQNSRMALAFSGRCVVMDRGSIVWDGASAELAADPELLDRLIGVGR